MIHRSSEYDQPIYTIKEPTFESSPGQLTQAVLAPPAVSELETVAKPLAGLQAPSERQPASQWIGYVMLGIGFLSLILAVTFTSTVLAFIGLGAAFWGILAFFIRPERYIKSDLLGATALSSLKTIDQVLVGMGYRERSVYLPSDNAERAAAFIPSEPFSRIPQNTTTIDDEVVLNEPQGLLIVPPGLALANLIEKKLGFKLKNCGVEILAQTLPKALTELEIAKDVEVEVQGDLVKFKLVDSIYADFCEKAQGSLRRCALGCPMCSALACILAIATGKPVQSEEEKSHRHDEKETSESVYRIVNEQRL